jgi:hypothetical protein
MIQINRISIDAINERPLLDPKTVGWACNGGRRLSMALLVCLICPRVR